MKIKHYIYISVVLILLFCYYRIDKLQSEIKRQRNEINAKDGVIFGINEAKKNYIEISTYQKDIKSLKNSRDSVENKMYRLLKDNNLKAKQIKEFQYSEIVIKDTIETIIEWSDSVLFGTATYTDQWLTAFITINQDSLNMIYSISCELYGIKYDKREKSDFFLFRWFGISLKKKQQTFRFYSDNEKIRFTDLRIIEK